jgi:hypothetical protein
VAGDAADLDSPLLEVDEGKIPRAPHPHKLSQHPLSARKLTPMVIDRLELAKQGNPRPGHIVAVDVIREQL